MKKLFILLCIYTSVYAMEQNSILPLRTCSPIVSSQKRPGKKHEPIFIDADSPLPFPQEIFNIHLEELRTSETNTPLVERDSDTYFSCSHCSKTFNGIKVYDKHKKFCIGSKTNNRKMRPITMKKGELLQKINTAKTGYALMQKAATPQPAQPDNANQPPIVQQ